MKNDVMPSIVQMDADELKTLLTEVKETVAKGIIVSEQPKRSFSAAELWNIRRNARTAISLLSR
jgi:hypothetical protein